MTIAIGVDVAEARKGLDVVALDSSRTIVASVGRATATDVAALAVSLDVAVVGIDGPAAWAPAGHRSRTAERQLRALGIRAFSTPTDPGDHPFYRWMRAGFAVYDAVAATHPLLRADGPIVGRCSAEVFPEATAVRLAGRRRSTDETKVRFRRTVLEANGVDAAVLPSADRVDAALAALTGILALEARCTTLGAPDEGLLLLPKTHESGAATRRCDE